MLGRSSGGGLTEVVSVVLVEREGYAQGNGRFLLQCSSTVRAVASKLSPLRRKALTSFAQASWQRRWSGVPPNLRSR